MLQIRNLTITRKGDLRTILSDFSLTLNAEDRAVLIGEEGDGKSTLLKWTYDPELVSSYAEGRGERILQGEQMAYLPQELPEESKTETLYEFFSRDNLIFDADQGELARWAADFGLDTEFFYDDRELGVLSGGEKVKAQLLRILLQNPDILLLDEPSNDIDISTLQLLEQLISEWKGIVLFVSHDETLIRNTANVIVHIEQVGRKTQSRYTVSRQPYDDYCREREQLFVRRTEQAENDRREKKKRDEKYQRIYQRVEHAQAAVSRQDPATAKLLKKKMHAVQSMGRRFEKEDARMTEMPEQEEAIFFRLGDENSVVPSSKVILDLHLPLLQTADGSRVLSQNIDLTVQGPEKLCIIGSNGCGKSTLLRQIVGILRDRPDLRISYMPQNYEELLDLDRTPVDFLDRSGDKEERTRIRTYLGALKYTADEMDHRIRDLSGGQKAKIYLLSMSLSDANVLLLDEPTRNFSPLSGPVIRSMIRDFPGAVISVSHDRAFINECCSRILLLTPDGLQPADSSEE